MVFIEGERAYPIYSFSATWIDVQPESTCEYRGERDRFLPDDRCFNSAGFDKMFKEEQAAEQLQEFINNWWVSYRLEKDKNGVFLLPKLTFKFIRHEVWCLTWFCHHTFDDGRTDGELLKSFQAFVYRMKYLNDNARRDTGKDAYFLMGAEDRWRWRGENDDRQNPICRCESCKNAGLVRINH